MGTWGHGIFENDVAMDVQENFCEFMEEGDTAFEATDKILESFSDVLEDPEEGSLVYIALAELQMEKNALQQSIKKQILKIFSDDSIYEIWEDSEDYKERKAELKDFVKRVEKYPQVISD